MTDKQNQTSNTKPHIAKDEISAWPLCGHWEKGGIYHRYARYGRYSKREYLWFKEQDMDKDIWWFSVNYDDNPWLQKFGKNDGYFFHFDLKAFVLSLMEWITIDVLHYHIHGNSHDESYEERYYRVGGSDRFDDYLKTVPMEVMWYENSVSDIKTVEDCTYFTRAYCTLNGKRFGIEKFAEEAIVMSFEKEDNSFLCELEDLLRRCILNL